MAVLKFLTVLLLASCVCADFLLKRKCPPDTGKVAQKCSELLIQDLLRDYSGGIPDLGIKPLDPIYLDEFEVNEDSLNLKFDYPNFRVTGFRDVIVGNVSQKEDTYAMTYHMSFSFKAVGPIRVELTQKKKAFLGQVKYEGAVSAEIIHTYSTQTLHSPSSTVTEHVHGPEQIACETNYVASTLTGELEEALKNDTDAQAVKDQYEAVHKEHQKKVASAIGEAIFKVALSNIRAYTRFTSWN